jgi:hypothetical protein
MNQKEDKFNKEDFNTFWNNMMAKKKLLTERCHKCIEEAQCKIKGLTGMDCEWCDTALLTMLTVDKMLSKGKKHEGMRHGECHKKGMQCGPTMGCGMNPGMMPNTMAMQQMNMMNMMMQHMMQPMPMQPTMMPNMMMPNMMTMHHKE